MLESTPRRHKIHGASNIQQPSVQRMHLCGSLMGSNTTLAHQPELMDTVGKEV